MLNKTHQKALWLITRLLALWLFGFSAATSANIGVDWLANQAQPIGQISTSGDIATPFVATAETLQTFLELGETSASQPSMTGALDFLNQEQFQSTVHLSRTLIANRLANASGSITELEHALVTRILEASGTGDLVDYNSTVLDTAWALNALAGTDTAIESLYPAVQFLLTQQHENGGWIDYQNNASVYTTAIVMQALWPYRPLLRNLPGLDVVLPLDQARDYLLANKNGNALWDETFESALALMALLPTLPTAESLTDSISALQNAQQANGSWEDDVYTTALALRVYKRYERLQGDDPGNETLKAGIVSGTAHDAQTGQGIAGLDIYLQSAPALRVTTDANGYFLLFGAPLGTQTVIVEGPEYAGVSKVVTLDSIHITDLGSFMLHPLSDDTAPSTLTLSGTVLDGITNAPLFEAQVALVAADKTQVSDADGHFQFEDIQTKAFQLTIARSGFVAKTFSVSVTHFGEAHLTFLLPPASDQPPAVASTLTGVVTDAGTGLPVLGSEISVPVENYAVTASDSGHYQLPGISRQCQCAWLFW